MLYFTLLLYRRVVVDYGVHHPTSASIGAKLAARQRECEDGVNASHSKASTTNIKIVARTKRRKRFAFVIGEQNIIRVCDNDSLEAFKLPQVHLASEKVV